MPDLRPVTLVTGASGGIGAELARVFATHGHELVLVARRVRQLEALADQLAAGGKRPHVLAIDLGTADCGDRIAAELLERGIEPEIVVNNAGFGLFGQAAELDRAAQSAMVDLNVRTATDLSLRWIDSLKRHRGGILNVASLGGFLPGPGMAVYHATKAYLISFSEALHRELKDSGVRVTVLCPGPVETEFFAQASMPDGYFPRRLHRTAGRVAREGYDGLMKGKRLVIPGTDVKVISFLPRLLPRALVVSLLAAYQRRRGR